MTDQEFQSAKATFPWKHRVIQNGLGGQVFLLDKNGKEVNIFTMMATIEKLTAHMSRPVEVPEETE